MKSDKHREVTDSALEREIESMLGVDPSPGFVPRVRSRIAAQSAPATWRFGWTILAAGAMTAAILLTLVIGRTNKTIPPAIPEPVPTAAVLTNNVSSEQLPPVKSVVSAGKALQKISQPSSGEPEMLISPAEAEALKRLISGNMVPWTEIHFVTIEPQPIPELSVTPVPLVDPASIVIKVEQSLPTIPKGEL